MNLTRTEMRDACVAFVKMGYPDKDPFEFVEVAHAHKPDRAEAVKASIEDRTGEAVEILEGGKFRYKRWVHSSTRIHDFFFMFLALKESLTK